MKKGAFHETPRPNALRYKAKFGKKQSHHTSYVECDPSSSDDGPHELESVSESVEDLFTMYKSEGGPDSPIALKPVEIRVTLKMELDRGASVSLISELVWREAFSESELVKYDVLLKTYTMDLF